MSAQAQAPDDPPQSQNAGTIQTLHYDHQKPDFSIPLTRTSGDALPSSTTFLSSQYDHGRSTPTRQLHLQFPAMPRGHQSINYDPSVGFHSLPYPPPFGGLPSMTVGGPSQFDQTYFQMQTLRQQNQNHNLEMARQTSYRNSTVSSPKHPPFGPSGPLNHDGQGFSQAQGRRSMVGSF